MPIVRPDLSDKLIHLTKGESAQAALNTLLEIVRQKTLIGGTGFIKGGYRCVCFCETPISHLALILANRPDSGFKYRPFGVMFSKEFIYGKGGRHVIYGEDGQFDDLPEAFKYRHVRYEPYRRPEPVDLTWEREWRIRADRLEFTPADATIVFPNRDFVSIASRQFPRDVDGIMPWHFVALEDLGVKIQLENDQLERTEAHNELGI